MFPFVQIPTEIRLKTYYQLQLESIASELTPCTLHIPQRRNPTFFVARTITLSTENELSTIAAFPPLPLKHIHTSGDSFVGVGTVHDYYAGWAVMEWEILASYPNVQRITIHSLMSLLPPRFMDVVMESGKPNADFVSEYDDPLRRMELNFRFFITVGIPDPETMADCLNNANDLPRYLRLLAFDISSGVQSVHVRLE